MATAKTAPFYLTAAVTLSDTNYTQTTIPLGSYIDVASKQAIAILEVDYVAQHLTSFSANLPSDRVVDYQVTDISQTALVRADDANLISAGALGFDLSPPTFSNQNKLYPDSFGTLEAARMVVNDDLFFGAQTSSVSTAGNFAVVRIKCQVVKLSEKDFMALALNTVASA
tara:strand:- start:1316 stop:1825 length:510 start_codon:yes stop_codon:yes gene_type:complete